MLPLGKRDDLHRDVRRSRHLNDARKLTTHALCAPYQPLIITGDGTTGHPGHGPYDGILATCGVNRIPVAWLRQLKRGGVIVTNIGTGIVRLTGQDDGSAQGRYLPEEAGFMLARPSADHVSETAKRYTGLIANATGRRTHTALPVASRAEADDFYRALVHPRALEVALWHHDVLSMTLRDSQRTMHGLIHPATESWARIVPDASGIRVDVEHDGERDLWTERLSLLLPWLTVGRPDPGTYGLAVNQDGHHTLWREVPEHSSWALPPVAGSPAAT